MSTDRQSNVESDPQATQASHHGDESAAAQFRKQVTGKRENLDDYDEEAELWSGGYSPKAMIGMWVLMAIVSLALLLLPLLAPVGFPIAAGLILVIWLLGGLRYAWKRLGYHYQLTSQRFVHQTGVLTRQTDRIEVIDIDDVSFSQGPVQRMFGVGTIVLSSSDQSHPSLSMIGIDKVKEVAGLIDDVRRKERRQRSLHIEAI